MLTSTFIIIIIAIVFGVFFSGAVGYTYSNRRQLYAGTLSETVVPVFDSIIEALGGFSVNRITALSTSAIPGMPYDVSLFAGKTEAELVILEGIKLEKLWFRHGEIRHAKVGMSRF